MHTYIDTDRKTCYNHVMENVKKRYSVRGPLTKNNALTTFDLSTPWKDANVAFNWINFEYPLIHPHSDWEILLVLQGQILHQINKSSQLLNSGDGCLIGPNDKHATYYPNNKKNDFQGVSILVRNSYMKEFLSMYGASTYEKILLHKEPLNFSISHNSVEKYTNMLLNIQDYEKKELCQQQCNIVFTYLILKILEQQASPSNIPDDLKDFVRILNNPAMTKEEILNAQKSLPYSYSQITRLFKKYLKCTITQYVNRVKMNYAKELLSSTDIPISQVAEELHFLSNAHFHTLFKETFNYTPLEYRKLNNPT